MEKNSGGHRKRLIGSCIDQRQQDKSIYLGTVYVETEINNIRSTLRNRLWAQNACNQIQYMLLTNLSSHSIIITTCTTTPLFFYGYMVWSVTISDKKKLSDPNNKIFRSIRNIRTRTRQYKQVVNKTQRKNSWLI